MSEAQQQADVARQADNAQEDEHEEQPQQPEDDQAPQSEEDFWAETMESDGLMDKDPEEKPDPEPKPKPEPKDQAPDNEAPEQPDQADQAPKWWNDLPEDARDEIKRTFTGQGQQLQEMQKRYNALHGKVAPVQRQLEQFRREKEDLEKRLKAFDSAPASVEELAKLESFKFLEEDSPDDARALKTAVAQMVTRTTEETRAKLERTTRALEDIRQDRTQRELNRLSSVHPDWHQAQRSQEFAWWRQAQPPEIQQQIAQMLSSPYADENIQVLSAFKTALQQARGSTQDGQTQPQGQQQPSQQAPAPNRRKPPKPSPPPQGSGVSGAGRIASNKSEEEMWAEEMDKRADDRTW